MRRTQERRSSTKWAKLVSDWRQSGLSAQAFAARHGLKVSTLSWWKWKLGTQASTVHPDSKPRLVPVEIVDTDPAETSGWELRSAAGHVLRVYEPLTTAQLEEILVVMAIGGAAP